MSWNIFANINTFFPEGKGRPGRETYNSPPSSAEVKNASSYNSAPPIRLYGVVLSSTTETNLTLQDDVHLLMDKVLSFISIITQLSKVVWILNESLNEV
jgi:hypothetical protein